MMMVFWRHLRKHLCTVHCLATGSSDFSFWPFWSPQIGQHFLASVFLWDVTADTWQAGVARTTGPVLREAWIIYAKFLFNFTHNDEKGACFLGNWGKVSWSQHLAGTANQHRGNLLRSMTKALCWDWYRMPNEDMFVFRTVWSYIWFTAIAGVVYCSTESWHYSVLTVTRFFKKRLLDICQDSTILFLISPSWAAILGRACLLGSKFCWGVLCCHNWNDIYLYPEVIMFRCGCCFCSSYTLSSLLS